jgi:hypothetical protein
MPVEFQSPFLTFQTPVHPRYASTTRQAAAGADGFAATLAATPGAAGSDAPTTADPAATGATGTTPEAAPAQEDQGGPDPSFMDPRERTVAFTRRDWKPQADSKDFHPFGDDGFTIDDVIDVVNPLQHIPLVSTVYRWLTGDTISPAAELAGGALYGGAVGFASAAATIALDGLTGGSTDQQVMVALLGPSPFAAEPAAASPAPDVAAAPASPQAPAPIELAQSSANDEGVPTSRGAGLASAALAAPEQALQEIPAGLIESLSQAPIAAGNPAISALPPTATVQPPAASARPPATSAQPPATSAQPKVIGAGSVTDSLPVVIPQTAAMAPRVTEVPSVTPAALSQPTRALKPLPPPLPAGFEVRNPPPLDTGGLGRSLGPSNPQHVDTAAVPAAMTRALDSYRKMMQDRSRDAVPVPGLDFQS